MNSLLRLNLALERRRKGQTSIKHQDFSSVSLRTGNFAFRFGFTRFVVVVVVVVVVLRRMLFCSLYVSHMASFSRRIKDIVFFSEP